MIREVIHRQAEVQIDWDGSRKGFVECDKQSARVPRYLDRKYYDDKRRITGSVMYIYIVHTTTTTPDVSQLQETITKAYYNPSTPPNHTTRTNVRSAAFTALIRV